MEREQELRVKEDKCWTPPMGSSRGSANFVTSIVMVEAGVAATLEEWSSTQCSCDSNRASNDVPWKPVFADFRFQRRCRGADTRRMESGNVSETDAAASDQFLCSGCRQRYVVRL